MSVVISFIAGLAVGAALALAWPYLAEEPPGPPSKPRPLFGPAPASKRTPNLPRFSVTPRLDGWPMTERFDAQAGRARSDRTWLDDGEDDDLWGPVINDILKDE